MLYLSLALIFLGILIFLYSIILDAKRRHDAPHSALVSERSEASGSSSGQRAGAPAGAQGGNRAGTMQNRGKRIPRSGQSASGSSAGNSEDPAPATSSARAGLEQKAVLFEDKSHVIDYSNSSGSIDPSLEEYKNIKRIGSGTISVESGGITFYMGKKLYRYDFHRIRDIKAGTSHLALFLMGSTSVKLFIIESGNGVITAAADAFREYVRSSA